MDHLIKQIPNMFKYCANIMDFSQWKKLKFWEKMFLYFCFVSVLGKLFEIAFWHLYPTTVIPFAQPYGFGAVAVIMFIAPLIRKKLTNPFICFILSTIIAGIVEYISAVAVIWIYGSNIFWDYSSRLLNLNGYICLEAAALFGILATIFIYCVYPVTEKIYRTQNKNFIHAIFAICLGLVVFETIYSVVLR